MESTKLPLTTWFLAFYLIGQAKTGISSLALMRQLGVHYRTAWLIHNKVMQAMYEREETYLLRGKVQIDDAYLGGERNGGKADRGSENKVPIVAAVSLDDAGHPLHVKLATVEAFPLPLLPIGARLPLPAALRSSATVLLEQDDHWQLEGRRLFSAESMAAIPELEDLPALQTASA